MAFEVFTRDFVRTTAPKITLTNFGRFSINNSGAMLLRKNQELWVLLLWDKAAHTVGIQPVKKEDNRTYPLKTYGPKGRSGMGFSAVTFLNFINYDWSKTRSFPVEWREAERVLAFTIPYEYLNGKPKETGPIGTPIALPGIKRYPRLKNEGE
jgi:hypothetical protein